MGNDYTVPQGAQQRLLHAVTISDPPAIRLQRQGCNVRLHTRPGGSAMRISIKAVILLVCLGSATAGLLGAADAVHAGGAELDVQGPAAGMHQPAPGWLHCKRGIQDVALTSRGDRHILARWIPIE